MNNNETNFPEYTSFPKTFEKYKWYKPLLVLLIGTIIYIILSIVTVIIFNAIFGTDIISSVMSGGYESLNSEVGSYVSYITVAIVLPSLYLATKIVKDRPFSSYSSSRGGWNWKLYFKCLTIPLITYAIFYAIHIMINGRQGPNTLTLTFFIICLIIVPIQCIAEEYLLRGFVMQTLGSWFNLPILAVILQAIIFAVMHPYSIFGVVGVLIDGLILGLFAWKTKGLEPGSAFHSVNNLSNAIVVALGFDVTTSTITLGNFAITIVLTLVTGIALYYIGNRLGWFSEKTSENKLI